MCITKQIFLETTQNKQEKIGEVNRLTKNGSTKYVRHNKLIDNRNCVTKRLKINKNFSTESHSTSKMMNMSMSTTYTLFLVNNKKFSSHIKTDSLQGSKIYYTQKYMSTVRTHYLTLLLTSHVLPCSLVSRTTYTVSLLSQSSVQPLSVHSIVTFYSFRSWI